MLPRPRFLGSFFWAARPPRMGLLRRCAIFLMMSGENGNSAGDQGSVDLHLHSTASDGRLDPSAVMAAAAEVGLAAVALTDHDTVEGLGEAARGAAERGLDFVPGIELSTYDEQGSTHLLGYCFDPGAGALNRCLEGAREHRVARAGEIVDKLNLLGMEISLEEVRAQAGEQGLIARPHIARALVEGGWVESYRLAFDRYIAAGQPAYVPTRLASPLEGIEHIRAAGGLAVLAHGGNSHDEIRIRQLVDVGLDGLEVYHPDHGPMEVNRLSELATELSLLRTGGSDWHGPLQGRHGRLGQQPVPYEWFEELKRSGDARRTV